MHLLKKNLVIVMASALALNPLAYAAKVTLQPAGQGPDTSAYVNDPSKDPVVPAATLQKLLQQKIKYVFVIFNENRSFDSEYGTFPGVNGLYSDGQNPRPPGSTPGFTQNYTDPLTGNNLSVQPFRVGPSQYANVVDSVDHSHTGLAAKLNVVGGLAQMNGFAQVEFTGKAGAAPTAASAQKGAQYANLVMSHVDCDTLPIYWQWASNFTIFDNVFATEDTPSTPNAVAMIAGQAGETQWVKHPNTTGAPTATGYTGTMNGYFIQGASHVSYSNQVGTTQGPPLVNDPQPFYGSQFDSTPTLSPTGVVTAPRLPYGPNESYGATNIASNLTFASVPLTLMGNTITATLAQNNAFLAGSMFDLGDIQRDIPYIQSLNRASADWRWYQNGYGPEATDNGGAASHAAFVSHHQGPQYFGYLANTPSQAAKLKSETQFFTDVANNQLPQGGVIYIRGGYASQLGLVPYTTGMPAAEAAAVTAAKAGDDNHPSYSDHYLSQAMNASVVNAIAGNPALWKQSAIIVTYDESDGFYDHVPPRILSYGPDGLPLSRGIRIPLLLISPYARTHAVSHAEGDHNAVIQTINAVFNLPALASLPDEAQALADGNAAYFNQFGPAGFQQQYLGPRDINSPVTDSLLSGFDPKRLLGISPPLPNTYAMVDPKYLTQASLPLASNGLSCKALNFTPVAPASDNVVPAGFNPLPGTYPAASNFTSY